MLELFDSETIIDEDAKVSDYKITKHDFIFSIYLSPFEGDIILSLKQTRLKFLIFEVGLSNITKLLIKKESPDEVKLVLYKGNQSKPLATIMIVPSISLNCNI